MEIKDLITEKAFFLDIEATDKNGVLEKIADIVFSNGLVTNKKKFLKALLKRESQGGTGMGEGIALPHARTKVVSKPFIGYFKTNNMVEWDSPDDLPINKLFLIAIPENNESGYMDALSNLSKSLIDPKTKDKILGANSFKELKECYAK